MQKKSLELSPKTMAWFGEDELRARVFGEKYALRDSDGRIVEEVPEQMWDRVAAAISSAEVDEAKRKEWHEKFFWLLSDFRMIPGGRIMFGAGQNLRRATLLNCYVLPIKGDSIEDIYETMKETARTYSFGGGVGVDISILRPKGSAVNNAAYTSTGSVSFMDLFSLTTGTIGQSGRRGALMITINCQHPDVEEFITIKNDPMRIKVRYANISVMMTDEFMAAVEKDQDWDLWYPDLLRSEDLQEVFGSSDLKAIVAKLSGKSGFVEIEPASRSFYDFPYAEYFYIPSRQELRRHKIYRTVKAKTVWEKIIHNAWSAAEPGVIFFSTMKKFSTSEYGNMHVMTTNPCSEIPLEPYGDCCLGNINLERFVSNAFEPGAQIDWENLEKAVRYTVHFLDDVLDYNRDRHPLAHQSEASMRGRRIGVGFTGLGDLFIKMGVRYDSEQAIDLADNLFRNIKNFTYDESVNIAEEKGVFPNFDPTEHLKSRFVEKLDRHIVARIKKSGLRNVALLTVPPVGSGAALAGVTSGVEPVFALSYTRRSESLSKEFFKVYHPLVRTYMERFGVKSEDDLPDFFTVSHRVDPHFRVRMQSVIQKHIDHSISSTVNLASDATEKYINDIYFFAWKLGCKGITVYREGSREGILLTDQNVGKKDEPTPEQLMDSFARTKVLVGETLKFRLPQGAIYITANKDEANVREVFINIGKSGGDEKADAEAIGRLISIYLQHGGSIQDVISQLEGIRGSVSYWDSGIQLHSIPDAIAKALTILAKDMDKRNSDLRGLLYDNHDEAGSEGLSSTQELPEDLEEKTPGIQENSPALVEEKSAESQKDDFKKTAMGTCPQCSEKTLAYENGCYLCKSCGYTKCS